MARALERDRQRRFGSALEMARALEVVARRYTRPTAEGVGLWLRGLFGGDRARLRRAIAEGVGVAEAVARLAEITGAPPVASGQPPVRPSQSRPLWVNSRTPVESMAVVTTPGPILVRRRAGARVRRSVLAPRAGAGSPHLGGQRAAAEAFAGGRLDHLGGNAGRRAGRGRVAGCQPAQRRRSRAVVQTQLATTGGLRIESQPAGAHIVIDGDPSGRQTPALLDGLPAGRTLDVQLQRQGSRRSPGASR